MTGTDFILVPPGPNVVDLLKAELPDFADSEEYRQVSDDDDLPYIVMPAFTDFLLRAASSAPMSGIAVAGLALLERLLALDDSYITKLIEIELFEKLLQGGDDPTQLIALMNPALREALKEWPQST